MTILVYTPVCEHERLQSVLDLFTNWINLTYHWLVSDTESGMPDHDQIIADCSNLKPDLIVAFGRLLADSCCKGCGVDVIEGPSFNLAENEFNARIDGTVQQVKQFIESWKPGEEFVIRAK